MNNNLKNAILNTALDYLENYKFPIIPMKSTITKEGDKLESKKKPLIAEVVPYRTKLPTREEVIKWWTKWPDAMIGCNMGDLADATVIDADDQRGVDKMEELLPESFEATVVRTPGSDISRHYWFKNTKGLSNHSTGILHIRTQGAITILPGSFRADGKPYYLENGSSLRDLKEMPSNIYNYLLSFSLYAQEGGKGGKGLYHNISQVSQDITKRFSKGNRNEDIFHIAYSSVKGNVNQKILSQALEIIAKGCEPPFPDDELDLTIKSALERANRKERNIAQEVNEWVEMHQTVSQGCHIKVTDWSHESQSVTTKKELHSARMQFKRLSEGNEPILEKVGGVAGTYRIIDREDNEQKWWLDEGSPLKLVMPLQVEKYAKIFPGNIILLEGEKSQGKSTFSIEFARLNRNLYLGKNIIYQNVEMSDAEIKDRFKHYQDKNIIKMEEWPKFLKIIKRTSDWADKIEADSINIIDYLVEYEKAYVLPKFIFNIHKKLKSGIALCVVQRDPFKPYPVGGRGTRDIPRLIISLIKHYLKLEDVKSFWETELGNPSGLGIKYKQVAYCEWKADGEWERMEDTKYTSFLGK